MPYWSYFPLSLVREKLAPRRAAEANAPGAARAASQLAIWMPATTVAAAGRKPSD